MRIRNVQCEKGITNALINSKLQHPPPGKTPGILAFEEWIVQIPTPSGQNGVQIPYPIVGFICQMPLLNNNCRWLPRFLSLQSKIINIEVLSAFQTYLKNYYTTFEDSFLLTNAISLPLNSSISSNHAFIAVSDFGARKKKKEAHLKPDTSGSIFPTPPGKGQIPYSPGTENNQMPGVYSGMGDVEISI